MNELESDPKVAALIRYSAPVLGVLLMLGAAALVSKGAQLLVAPAYRAPLDSRSGGLVLLTAAAGVLVLAWRLITGRRAADGGVLPRWLIVAGALLFLLAPVVIFRITREGHLALMGAVVCGFVAASGFRVVLSRRN
jgi:hypothetical protein